MSSKKKTTTKSRRPTLTKKKSKQILSSMRRSISQIEHSMTSKQKKELKNISLDLANTHQQLIRFKEEGKLPEFLRDVCQLNKTRLLEFCSILKVKTLSSDSYDSICEKIIKERPDLFKQPSANNWKSWVSGLASIPATYLGYKIPDWISRTSQKLKENDTKYRILQNEIDDNNQKAKKRGEEYTSLENKYNNDWKILETKKMKHKTKWNCGEYLCFRAIGKNDEMKEEEDYLNKETRELKTKIDQLYEKWRGQPEDIASFKKETNDINQQLKRLASEKKRLKEDASYYGYIGYALGAIALIAGAAGVRYYRLKHLQIAAAIQYLRNNPDLERVSKQIARSYSRSHSRTQSRKKSSLRDS